MFYLKILTSNELGYRKGILKTGQHFYISKEAKHFFPSLSSSIPNDYKLIPIKVEYSTHIIEVKYVYHNDKYSRKKGTRDEYRIYVNREISPDDYYFRPNDILIIEKKENDNVYYLSSLRSNSSLYSKIFELIKNNSLRGNHAMVDSLI
ncbi:MAG: hypothetical protein RL259_420 [Bacteroidota bacterium]|jgi:hypothetical protein